MSGWGFEPRALIIFFCDPENFLAHAEELTPDESLRQSSEYFPLVTEAAQVEHETFGKFIVKMVKGRQGEFMIHGLLGLQHRDDPELTPHPGDR